MGAGGATPTRNKTHICNKLIASDNLAHCYTTRFWYKFNQWFKMKNLAGILIFVMPSYDKVYKCVYAYRIIFFDFNKYVVNELML